MSATEGAVIIAGRYQVRRLLGTGAHGEVFEVFDVHLGATYALKLLRDMPRERWREAQIMREVHGEFVLPVRNADIAEGRAYVVTDLATLGTVETRIPEGIGTDVDTAVRWARQACQGVARLHDHRLLHGDLKPENLFVNARDEVLVGDLGLSQLMNSEGMALAGGSPPTMAPEVAEVFALGGFAPNPYVYGVRCDVYSLGATLYWMLAGVPVVPGTPAYAEIAAASERDLWDVAPHVSRKVRDVVNRAIRRDASERFASPAEMDAALGGRTISSRTWQRIEPHEGHAQCFVGEKPGARTVQVCAVPTGRRSQVRVVAVHVDSGRAVRRVNQTSSPAALPRTLRSVFGEFT